MLDAPQIVQATQQMTAVVHLTVARTGIAQVMGPAIGEVMAAIGSQGASPCGPCFSFHRRRPTDTFDFEVGFPVDRPIPATGRVYMSALPAARVVRADYHGGYEGLGDAWGRLLAWTEQQGLAAQDCLWESYVSGPESGADPARWCTRLNRPLLAAA